MNISGQSFALEQQWAELFGDPLENPAFAAFVQSRFTDLGTFISQADPQWVATMVQFSDALAQDPDFFNTLMAKVDAKPGPEVWEQKIKVSGAAITLDTWEYPIRIDQV
ncbi:MAG TPA: hypothetical protein DCE41_00830, partial [Cytophagales bacterium]|nr:hypothetical protein [Cytophagales bacterium]